MIATEKHVDNLKANIDAQPGQLDKLSRMADSTRGVSNALTHGLKMGDLDQIADALGSLEALGRNAKGWLDG